VLVPPRPHHICSRSPEQSSRAGPGKEAQQQPNITHQPGPHQFPAACLTFTPPCNHPKLRSVAAASFPRSPPTSGSLFHGCSSVRLGSLFQLLSNKRNFSCSVFSVPLVVNNHASAVAALLLKLRQHEHLLNQSVASRILFLACPLFEVWCGGDAALINNTTLFVSLGHTFSFQLVDYLFPIKKGRNFTCRRPVAPSPNRWAGSRASRTEHQAVAL
jgi:hypothetical protein